jgi:hypothetical protein
MVRAIRKALLDLGVYAEVNLFNERQYTIAREKAPNAPFAATDVRCVIVFRDGESGETLTASGLGTGVDLGDKSTYKAQTGSIKYALKNAFLVPDEADPEADETVDRAAAEPAPRKGQHSSGPATETFYETPAPAVTVPAAIIPPPAKAVSAAEIDAAQREPGDKSEVSADGTLPTEDEKNEYRVRFNKIVDNLSSTKSLSASKNLKVEKKFVVFLLQTVGAKQTGEVTRGQWEDFLARAEMMGTKENGWAILAKKINAANGVESK